MQWLLEGIFVHRGLFLEVVASPSPLKNSSLIIDPSLYGKSMSLEDVKGQLCTQDVNMVDGTSEVFLAAISRK